MGSPVPSSILPQMLPQMSGKMAPLLFYGFAFQLLLIALAILVGAVLLLRRFIKRNEDAGNPLEARQIAEELQSEIQRLRELKRKIYPEGEVADAPVTTASPAPLSDVAPTAAPTSAINVEEIIQARTAEMRKNHDERVAKLEAELAEARKQPAAATAPTAAAAPAPAGDNGAQIQAAVDQAVEKQQSQFEQERLQLNDKVVHLEKVLSEYRLFEDDFALVKRYKVENEALRRQVTETHKVTEDDIANLFQSLNLDAAAPAPAAAAAPSATASTESPAAPKETAADSNFFFKEEFGALTSDAPAVEAPAPVETAAKVPAEAPTVQPVATVDVSANAAETAGFEVEKNPTDPVVAKAAPAPESVEDLAESAVNDDKLLEEFQKILGGDHT